MRLVLILQLLILISLANSAPVLAKKILGARLAWPLDGGIRFFDGQPLFGISKTLRGVVLAVLATAAGAPLVGLDWRVGATVGAGAMAGDLLSSFVKRRLRLPPSSKATGLDQIPEAAVPLLACQSELSLTAGEIALATAIFFAGVVLLSRLFHRLGLRDQPY